MSITAVRRRPGITQCIEFTGDNGAEIADWAGPRGATYEGGRLVIHTRQGDMEPSIGDRVMRSLLGRYYPITPEEFAAGWQVIG